VGVEPQTVRLRARPPPAPDLVEYVKLVRGREGHRGETDSMARALGRAYDDRRERNVPDDLSIGLGNERKRERAGRAKSVDELRLRVGPEGRRV
jgi:hypothetical protein